MMKSTEELKESYTFVNDTTDELKEEQKKQSTSIKSLEESIARTGVVINRLVTPCKLYLHFFPFHVGGGKKKLTNYMLFQWLDHSRS